MHETASPNFRFFAMLKLNWCRNLFLFSLIILTFFIQFGFLNALGWKFFTPNLLYLFPVFAALLEGPRKGLFWGFCMGLLWDLFIGRYIGLHALSWSVAAWLTGVLCAKFYKENYLVPVVALAIMLLISQLTYVFFMGVLGGFWPSFFSIAKNILYAMLVNGVAAMIAYVPVYKSFTEGFLQKKLLSDAK